MNENNDRDQFRQTARALNSGAIHLLRGLRVIDRQVGLTPARLSALSVLVFGGPKPLGKLAGIEDVTSPTMTRIVDGLCELGLAERTMHPANGRIAMIAATKAGIELMLAAADRRIDAIAAAIDALLPEDQLLLNEAASLLDELAARLRSTQDQDRS